MPGPRNSAIIEMAVTETVMIARIMVATGKTIDDFRSHDHEPCITRPKKKILAMQAMKLFRCCGE